MEMTNAKRCRYRIIIMIKAKCIPLDRHFDRRRKKGRRKFGISATASGDNGRRKSGKESITILGEESRGEGSREEFQLHSQSFSRMEGLRIGILFLLLCELPLSYACSNRFGCSNGVCDPPYRTGECNCSRPCSCFDSCTDGYFCTQVKNSSDCNLCLKTPSPCPSTNYHCSPMLNDVNCSCKGERTGKDCEFAMGDNCASYPCLNSGKCMSNSTHYRCNCMDKFSGYQCQHEKINPCLDIDCGSTGQCIAILGGTAGACNCTSEWQGPKCEQPVKSRSCGNQCTGVCIVAPDTSTLSLFNKTVDGSMSLDMCRNLMMNDHNATVFILSGEMCLTGKNVPPTQPGNETECDTRCPGNNGERCGTTDDVLLYHYPFVVDPVQCNATVCGSSSEGFCVEEQGKYSCLCAKGRDGSNCESKKNPCAAFDCANGGSCKETEDSSSAYCVCSSGTAGPKCDKRDECWFKPCKNGGKCLNTNATAAGFNCSCPKDGAYVGPTCETFLTCRGLPCIHGTCTDKEEGNYECHCTPGYTGANCEIDINECENRTTVCNRLDKKAECVDLINNWSCRCGPQYTGKMCEINLIIYRVLQSMAEDVTDEDSLIKLLEDLVESPSKIAEMVPFLIGLQSQVNRSRMSHSKEDFFQWVAYEKKSLDLNCDLFEWNDVVLGNCFTFNHFAHNRTYALREPGARGALSAMIKLNKQDYLNWTESEGVLVFVHSNTERIYLESPRLYAEPGTQVTIYTSEHQYKKLGGRYGRCIKEISEVRSFYYTGSYTTDGCLRSCFQDEVKKACGCFDPRYPFPDNQTVCDLKDRRCVERIVSNGDITGWALCDCPLPCHMTQYKTSVSKVNAVRTKGRCNGYTKAQQLEDDGCKLNTTAPDYVIVNIVAPDNTVLVFSETASMTFNQFIGAVGGIGGVLLGLTFISLVEFIYFFCVLLPYRVLFNRAP